MPGSFAARHCICPLSLQRASTFMPIFSFQNRRLRSLFVTALSLWALSGSNSSALAATPSANDGFNPNPNSLVTSIAVQSDGQVIFGGNFTQLSPNGVATGFNRIARVSRHGVPDTSFNPNINGKVDVIVLQPNGQILVGGEFTAVQPNGASSATSRNY